MNHNKSNLNGKYSPDYAIELFNLTKKYKLKGRKNFITALNNINLRVKPGEIFGLLGPNGAGKTTMVSILTTLIQPTLGYATIFGHNILTEAWYVRENVGLMLGDDMVYNRLTGYMNLKYFCKLYGIQDYKNKINRLAEMLNLSDWINQYVSNYSKGMKMKLALARVLIIEPKVLFLDEPTLGLDPKSVVEIISFLKRLNITIFFTSHQMDVVSKLCDSIAFLKKGNIIKIDSKENFKKIFTDKVKIQLSLLNKNEQFIKEMNNLNFVDDISQSENFITFYIRNNSFFPKLFEFLKEYPIISMNEIQPSLEDVFIKLAD